MTEGRAFEYGALAGASKRLHDNLRELARTVVFPTGHIVFGQGDPGAAIYAVLQGEVEISTVSEDGRKLVLNIVTPGEVFGEIAMFDGGPRTASAVAHGALVLARVSRAQILRKLRDDAGLAEDILMLAGARLRWISERFEDLAFLPLQTRLARRLIYLLSQTDHRSFTLALSQAELAEHVGATREAVSKILALWRREGWIGLSRGRIEVLNTDILERLGEDFV